MVVVGLDFRAVQFGREHFERIAGLDHFRTALGEFGSERHNALAFLDAQTADGARRWNDANALALSLRATSEAELTEILDAWFAAQPSTDGDDRDNVSHLGEIESGG